MYSFSFIAAANKTGRVSVPTSTTTTAPASVSLDLSGVKIQTATWANLDYNTEDYFINIFWYDTNIHGPITSDRSHRQLTIDGNINPDTLLPKGLPSGSSQSYRWGGYFLNPVGFSRHVHRVGRYYLTWQGDFDVTFPAGGNVLVCNASVGNGQHGKWLINTFNNSVGTDINKILFATPRSANASLTSVALVHEDDVSAWENGKILTPHFRRELSRHHIFRSMDLRAVNGNLCTSIGNYAAKTRGTVLGANNYNGQGFPTFPNDWDYTYQKEGTPNWVPIRMAVEASVELWDQHPLMIDSPFWYYTSAFISGYQGSGQALWNYYQSQAQVYASAILFGDGYDEICKAYVSALISENYPEDRLLYNSLGNEVWNNANAYIMGTNWARGFGLGYRNFYPEVSSGNGAYDRIGYGAQLGKFMLSMEDALSDVGRPQQILYVIESQAAAPVTTLRALEGIKHYVSTFRGLDWDLYKGKIAVSPGTYWGDEACLYKMQTSIWNALGKNYNSSAMHQAIRNRIESKLATSVTAFYASVVNWIAGASAPANDAGINFAFQRAQLNQHKSYADAFGVIVIGGYEGGSHMNGWDAFAQSLYGADTTAINQFRYDYKFGELGATINQLWFDNLITEFGTSGWIVTNYVWGGVPTAGAQPWFDGIQTSTAYWASAQGIVRASTAMQESWNKYKKF